MRAYDGRGNLISKAKLIEEAGFVVGSHVVRKADETEAKIVGFEGDNVVITISDGLLSGRCKVHVRSFLNREWSKYTPKKEKSVIATLWQHQPQFNDEFIHAYLRGVAMVEIIGHSTEYHETTKHLTVYAKPIKSVVANKPFEKGTLKLVPGTTKFYGFPDGQEPTSNCLVPLGTLVKNDDDVPVNFYLGPQMDLPKMGRGFAPPFWFVTTTEKEEDANMKILPDLSTYVQHDNKLEDVEIVLPLMVNTKDVDANENLICFREPRSSEQSLEEIVRYSPLKKRRTGKQPE